MKSIQFLIAGALSLGLAGNVYATSPTKIFNNSARNTSSVTDFGSFQKKYTTHDHNHIQPSGGPQKPGPQLQSPPMQQVKVSQSTTQQFNNAASLHRFNGASSIGQVR